MASGSSDGERLMAAYLRQRRMPYEYERAIGTRHPDFSVDHPRLGTLVFEVYEPGIQLPPVAGSFDSIPDLQGAFENRKKKQIAAVKGARLPYIAVVADTRSDIPIDPLLMAGAMFGRPTVALKVAVDPQAPAPDDDGHLIFGDGARLQPEQMRGVSAVALLRRFNPTQWRYEAAVAALAARGGRDAWRRGRREQYELFRAFQQLSEDLTAAGSFDPEARLCRLVLLHNPYAYFPLSPDFAGLHDTQWGHFNDSQGEHYGVVAEGRLGREVVGVPN